MSPALNAFKIIHFKMYLSMFKQPNRCIKLTARCCCTGAIVLRTTTAPCCLTDRVYSVEEKTNTRTEGQQPTYR